MRNKERRPRAGGDGGRSRPERGEQDRTGRGRPDREGGKGAGASRDRGASRRSGSFASRREADAERGGEARSNPAPRGLKLTRTEPEATGAPAGPMRIAKALARAGLCSRREAERWIEEGRVAVNGKVLKSPALDVGPEDKIVVDGKLLPTAEPPKLWRYHKPKGLVTTHRDPEGRPTVFDKLPAEVGRVISIGRLDFNTEGLLLLTNDGALARHMELPATGWLRRYRVRAHGRVTQADLDRLKQGVEIEGVRYGPVDATLDKDQGANVWLSIGLREGKNREVRKILGTLGLDVNRLIRVSFGPFQLLDLAPGAVEPVKRRVLLDQVGERLARELGLADETEARRITTRSRRQKPAAGAKDTST